MMVIGIAVAIVAPELVSYVLTNMGGVFVEVLYGAHDGLVLLSSVGQFTATAVSGFASGAIASGSFEGGLQGAFTAGMFYGAGDLISGTGAFAGGAPISDKFAQAAVHGVVGCVTSVAGGGRCGPGAMAAAFSKFATVNGFVGQDVVSGTITSAIVGGTASVLGGGKFANGATTGAFGYLFNCLNHPGVCTKVDQPDIRKAAVACGGDSSCIQQIAVYARESGIPLPPDLGQSLKEFLGITTLPIELSPAGRALSTTLGAMGAAKDYYDGSTRDANGAVAGIVYGDLFEVAVKPIGRELAGRAGAVAGKVMEWVWTSDPPPRKP